VPVGALDAFMQAGGVETDIDRNVAVGVDPYLVAQLGWETEERTTGQVDSCWAAPTWLSIDIQERTRGN
jgi:hypothetical protein